jgi:hypothetical protein
MILAAKSLETSSKYPDYPYVSLFPFFFKIHHFYRGSTASIKGNRTAKIPKTPEHNPFPISVDKQTEQGDHLRHGNNNRGLLILVFIFVVLSKKCKDI